MAPAPRLTFAPPTAALAARARAHLRRAEQAAEAPPAPPIETIAVLGASASGTGVALAALAAGLGVVLVDADEDARARAQAHLDRHAPPGAAAGLRLSADAAAIAAASFGIEASEDPIDLRQRLFALMERHLPAGAVLASAEPFGIDQIAARLSDPARLLGLRVHGPAAGRKLVEILRAPQTCDRALAAAQALAGQMGRLAVVAGGPGGFIGARLLARCMEAADTLMMDGSNPWEIDEAMVAFGMAPGPYEAQDITGLDLACAERRQSAASRDRARRHIPITERMVNEGRLGRKVGVGWYRYPGGGGKVIDPLVEDLAREEAWFAGVARRPIDEAEIVERLVLAMINEAAAMLSEGFAARASDIDLVTVLGLGFPPARGGLMHLADTIGAARIVARLQDWAGEDPVVWSPAPALERAARAGLAPSAIRP